MPEKTILEIPYETLSAMLNSANEQWAEDNTFIENLCALNGVSEFEIYGDSYGVPGIQDKVISLVKKLNGKTEQ